VTCADAVAALDERLRRDRRARHELLDKMRTLTSLPRVAKCMRVSRSGGGVGLRIGEGRAGFSGLCTCGNVHACPVHAAKIGAERAREEIAPVIRHVIDQRHGSVLMCTFTVQHRAGMPLAETRAAVQGAWQHLGVSRAWRRLDAEHGRLGFCRAFEATWGQANGWHPHLHVLLFLDREVDELGAAEIAATLYRTYRAGLARAGFDASAMHGVDVKVATTRRDAETVLSKYLTKIASEVTRQDRKQGKHGRFTPFELLREAAEWGNADALDRWHEWEQATAGTRQLTWSVQTKQRPGIRELAGVRGERTDQEIADEDIGDPTAVVIPSAEWSRVCPERTGLLDAAEEGGVLAAVDWLDARGVAWEVPPHGYDDPCWRADVHVTRELLRRSARMLLPAGGRYLAADGPGRLNARAEGHAR
jgi:hypothetical protein